jgi:hypothetical protein
MDFVDLVAAGVFEHPEWVPDVIRAIGVGVSERLAQEQAKRAGAETSVALLAGNFKHVAEHQKEIVARALVNSHCFGGTEYAKDIAVKYLKPEVKG